MYSFHSEQVHMTTDQGRAIGQRNVVDIQNGKGYKEHSVVGPNGKTRKRVRHRLSPGELRKIQRRKFIPALFRCCRSTRKQKQRV
jgi:hypothetical protein